MSIIGSWLLPCGALQYGETPLHMAAKNGCSDAARLLLAHGAYIEAKANVIFFPPYDPSLKSF